MVLAAIGGKPAAQGKGDERADSQGDADGLIRMGLGRILRSPGALAGFVVYGFGQFLSVIEGRGQAMARGVDFVAGDISGGAHEFTGVVGQVGDFVANCLQGFVHGVGLVCDDDEAGGW